MASARSGPAITAVTTPVVCRLAVIRPSTLDYWARTNLVKASIRGSSGRRVTRLWSVCDVVVVRAMKALRDAGCSLQRLRKARRLIERELGDQSSEAVLYWDGHDVLALLPAGELMSTIRAPGQLALHIVALPLMTWLEDARAHAIEVVEPMQCRNLSARARAS